MDRLRHIYLLTGIIAMMLGAAACSTQKNTAGSRRYHAITARFNAMYNGQVAYDEGVDAQERGHIDNYNELLPMFVVADAKTAKIGKNSIAAVPLFTI